MKKLILIATLLASSSSWGACISGNCTNGIGTFTHATEGKYVGEFKDGKPHGQGVTTFTSGNKYVGEFKNAEQHGQGTYTFANGNKYVGEFEDDKYHGQGTYSFANGNKYVGEFQDNKYHGQGTLTLADGVRKHGVWKNNIYVGTKAELDAKERTRKAKKETERKVSEETRQTYERIYNACLIDKSSDVDMQVRALRIAVEETCEAIAEDPSWYENFKYN